MRKLLPLVAAVALAACGGGDDPEPQPGIGVENKRACGYGQNTISGLARFEKLVGARFSCALVYVDSPDWAGWEKPYILNPAPPDTAWANWVRRDPRRRDLIITQTLFPKQLAGTDWLKAGAAGAFDSYAKAFARNLVQAGLRHSVIRLAHEANFTQYAHQLPPDAAGQKAWGRVWRRVVLAMKSVPGAAFRFDLTVNAAVRPIPLERFWPGDDVVDIVGVDAYDSGIREQKDRWRIVYERPLGVRDVLAFAKAHDKPISIPEWGIAAKNDSKLLSGGDNVDYVEGIAKVVRGERVAYQAYFFNHEWAAQLPASPRSLAAYKEHFGRNGDSLRP